MAMPTVHQLPDEVRSDVRSEDRIKLGSMLAKIGREIGLTDEEFAVFEQIRDNEPARPVNVE